MLNATINRRAAPAAMQTFYEKSTSLAAEIRKGASEREINRELPFDAFRRFKDTGIGAIRLPIDQGGAGASVSDVVKIVSEIAASDSNVAHALRSHFNFVELQITTPGGVAPDRYLSEIRRGAIFGGAHTEIGTKKPGEVMTSLTREGGGYRLNGRKFYTTGTAFSDWVSASATNPDGEIVWVLLPTTREGVKIRDDWNGMGQRLTASGGVDFENVAVEKDEVTGRAESSLSGRHASTFRQLYLAACAAGIVRNVLADTVEYVKTKARPITHSHSDTARGDYFVQEAVGEIASISFAIDSLLLAAAATVDQAHHAILMRDDSVDRLLNDSSLEVAKVQIISGQLALQAATRIFDTGGASATSRSLNFDRHWRNLRTLLSHNPLAYKMKVTGDYLLNDVAPPTDGGFF